MENFLQQLGSLGVSFSSYAIGTQEDWPFVIISNFEAQAAHFYEQQPSAKSLGLSVLVMDALRIRWEEYVQTASPSWIEESYNFLQVDSTDIPLVNPSIFRVIAENGTMFDDPGDDDPYYFPFWMVSLVQPEAINFVNYNTLDNLQLADVDKFLIDASNEQATPVVSTPPKAEDSPSYSTDEAEIPESAWPQSTVATALFNSFNQDTRTRVATLSATVFWDSFFQDIFEDGELDGPFIMALQDTCGESYMYLISGSSVRYTGSSDEPSLPDHVSLVETYSSIPLTGSKCSLVVHIAPSDEMVEASSTSTPIIYTAAIVGIFAIMAVFFWLYDRLTGKSYHDALNKVERSKNIVDSFFPSNIRDRVLNDRSQRTEAHSRGGNSSHRDEDDVIEDLLQRSRHGLHNKPIADLHPNVTVLFADVANFTVRKMKSSFLPFDFLVFGLDLQHIFIPTGMGKCQRTNASFSSFGDTVSFLRQIMSQVQNIQSRDDWVGFLLHSHRAYCFWYTHFFMSFLQRLLRRS